MSIPHFYSYGVETGNQNAALVIGEAHDNLKKREDNRVRLQGQLPLTGRADLTPDEEQEEIASGAAADTDWGLVRCLDRRIKSSANSKGNVTCRAKLEFDIETPPVSEEEG